MELRHENRVRTASAVGALEAQISQLRAAAAGVDGRLTSGEQRAGDLAAEVMRLSAAASVLGRQAPSDTMQSLSLATAEQPPATTAVFGHVGSEAGDTEV